MLTARSDTDETAREVSERVYRGTHTHSRNPTHTLPTQCPVLSGELIPGATPHVVPAGDRTRVGRLATASATTELHARSLWTASPRLLDKQLQFRLLFV